MRIIYLDDISRSSRRSRFFSCSFYLFFIGIEQSGSLPVHGRSSFEIFFFHREGNSLVQFPLSVHSRDSRARRNKQEQRGSESWNK